MRRPWRPADDYGCGCGGVIAAGVVGHASNLLHRLLFYICCCLSHEESSELCREWVERPVGGRGRSEDEGKSQGLCPDNPDDIIRVICSNFGKISTEPQKML